MRSVGLVRILEGLTAAYSVAIMARPQWLARPCRLTDSDGHTTPATATLVRAIGARDTVIGTAMLLAGNLHALRAVGISRAAADLSDAVVFGGAVTGSQRAKVAGLAAGWGALCASATLSAARGPADCVSRGAFATMSGPRMLLRSAER